jgi:hypothetical protein
MFNFVSTIVSEGITLESQHASILGVMFENLKKLQAIKSLTLTEAAKFMSERSDEDDLEDVVTKDGKTLGTAQVNILIDIEMLLIIGKKSNGIMSPSDVILSDKADSIFSDLGDELASYVKSEEYKSISSI